MGKAKEEERMVIGGALRALLISARSLRSEEVVDLAAPRSWESEMEGCVSNLMICNLAYSGKLEELKERILADKSLATRTDQVKQRWTLSAGGGGGGGGDNVAAQPCPVQGEAGSERAGFPPAPPHPYPWVTSGLGIERPNLAPQTANVSPPPTLARYLACCILDIYRTFRSFLRNSQSLRHL